VVFVIVHATHSFVAKDILFLADLCCKCWVLAYFGGIAEICGIAALAMGSSQSLNTLYIFEAIQEVQEMARGSLNWSLLSAMLN